MRNFQYYNSTKVIFGRGQFACLGENARRFGKRALLVEIEGPLKELGVFQQAIDSMEAEGMRVFELSGVTENPHLTVVDKGIKLAKEKDIDVIVAVGGGSSIDTAKAISLGAATDLDIWEYFNGSQQAVEKKPVVAVSTIAASGSEMSCHCILTNDRSADKKDWKKWALHDELLFPEIAIVDAELVKTVPKRLTAAGMADINSHVLEGYFDDQITNNDLGDYLAESVVKTILENDSVLEKLDDLDARENISWAATLAMNGLPDCGRDMKGFPCHWIQHAVGAMTNSSHGEGLAVIEPAWLKNELKKDVKKFIRFNQNVLKLERNDGISDEKYAEAGIDRLRQIYDDWGLPSTLRELGVTKEMIPKIIEEIMNNNEAYEFDPKDIQITLESCF
ncbi:iron-containing alcohol dehydrogenase [Enterococcus gilvus]|uniref:iron-containing alcohol dehydrogenase n=1 Tax=Enterococcus gilvus TaxID=160453 RepID=UPI001C8B6EE9|nr:iron-containing alcohol dehydrogenase [Enterococcus gilvus]MBX8935441.1 iron-containing alcohol dehydrogenase [Enterococcus gilvus]